MNEKIDLTKILKDCPKDFELYSTLCGTILFSGIRYYVHDFDYPVKCRNQRGELLSFTKEGRDFLGAECVLFPSKDQRDWSKFKAPWYKKDKFDPKMLKPFDRVLVRDYSNMEWICDILSHIKQGEPFPYVGIGSEWKCCIPYNDDTKHLVGRTDAAPEFYRYWWD